MNWKTWLHGLTAVAIGGAATGAAQAVAGGSLNRTTAITAGIGALSTVLAYLCKSPLVLLQQNDSGTGLPEDNPGAPTTADPIVKP